MINKGWFPAPGEDFSEYCGGSCDCKTCVFRDRCGQRERIEAAMEEEMIGGEEE